MKGNILRLIGTIIIVVLAAFTALKLLTGCALVEKAAPKDKIVAVLKTAYAEGGQAAVSNHIEKLVVSGDLSRKQADKLHVLAESIYEHILEKLDESDIRECLEEDNDPFEDDLIDEDLERCLKAREK